MVHLGKTKGKVLSGRADQKKKKLKEKIGDFLMFLLTLIVGTTFFRGLI